MTENKNNKTKWRHNKEQVTTEEVYGSPLFLDNQKYFVRKGWKNLALKDYFRHDFRKDLLFICFSSFLTVIGFDYFISASGSQGIYPGGLGSIARFLAVIVTPGNNSAAIAKQSTFYYVWYLVLNVPFMVFGFWKLGLRFSMMTIAYMVLQIGFDQIVSHLPVINPSEWHMITDYPLVEKFANGWNTIIWLFIFAIIGGVIIGFAYSLVYRANGSTGGADFVTFFFSVKKNKNIGSLNRYVNFAILTLIIILNTIFLNIQDLPSQAKVSVINHASNKDFQFFLEWYEANKTNLSWSDQLENILKAQQNALNLSDSLSDAILNNRDKFDKTYHYFINQLAQEKLFTSYPGHLVGKIRFYYIFGSSLFSSIVYIIVCSNVVNFNYPKYKVRTYVISTTRSDELIQTLQNQGYRNEINVSKPEQMLVNGQPDPDRKIITLAMTVINWKAIYSLLLKTDPNMVVKVVTTKKIEGKFDYEFSNDHVQNYFTNEILNNKKSMKKITKLAYQKTKRDLLVLKQKEKQKAPEENQENK